MNACLRGDERACKQLYDSYAPKMMGLCLRYSGSRDVAQDILAEGFIKVFTNLKDLQKVQSLEAWICRVMVNTAINEVRMRRDFLTLDDPDAQAVPSALCYDTYDTEQLMKAIQKLSPKYRLIFNLHEVEGYSYEEISAKLGLESPNVRLILTRAKRKLQQLLGARENYI